MSDGRDPADHRFRGDVRCPNGGKIVHMTRELAKEALRRMRSGKTRRGVAMPAMHVYECPYCHMWHVGSDRWGREDAREAAP